MKPTHHLCALAVTLAGSMTLSSAQAATPAPVDCVASYYESPTPNGGTISEESALKTDFHFGDTLGLATELRGRHFSANLDQKEGNIKIFIIEAERPGFGTMTTGVLTQEGRWTASQVEGTKTYKVTCTSR